MFLRRVVHFLSSLWSGFPSTSSKKIDFDMVLSRLEMGLGSGYGSG